MSCCGSTDVVAPKYEFHDQLPDKVYCCMARTAHNITRGTLMAVGLRNIPLWDDVPENLQDTCVGMVKTSLQGIEPDLQSTYNKAFHAVVSAIANGV